MPWWPVSVQKRMGAVGLTGGPGAGKTAVLELIRQSFCEHVKVLPEAASVVFGGGFPPTDDFLSSIGTTRADQLARYNAIIRLRTPTAERGYNRQNPLRTESASAAAEIDVRILQAWQGHPRRFVVESTSEFLEKAARTLELLRAEMPECCRRHVVPAFSTTIARG